MKSPLPAAPRIQRFPAAKQRRMDELLDKNSEGTISPRERKRLEELVNESERLAVANAKRIAAFVEAQRIGGTERAVPVTIWIQPETSQR